MESNDLREIVDRATGSDETKRERRPRRPIPSRVWRVAAGLLLFGAGLAGICYALVRLMHTGTCASGGPYVIGHQCPGDTGMVIGVLIGSIFLALIGAAVAGVGLLVPMGLGFTAIGGAALIGGLTAPSSVQGAAATGYGLGITFIAAGLAMLGFSIASWRWSRTDNTEPVLTAAGIWQVIGATAPHPLDETKTQQNDDPGKDG